MAMTDANGYGMISIVLVPTGSPDRISVRALRRIRDAGLVPASPEVFEILPALGRSIDTASTNLIPSTAIDAAKSGQAVAVLLPEERVAQVEQYARAAKSAGLPYEVIPSPPPELWENAASTLPLKGRTVLVTRPVEQAGALAELLEAWGARVVFQPTITIAEPDDHGPLDQAIRTIETCDWLVFSSTNGVEYFMRRLLVQGRDVRALGRLMIAAIGPGTRQLLEKWGLHADVVPETYRAESLAKSLCETPIRGKRVLLIRASRGREVLAERLSGAGADVQQAVAYASRDVETADPRIAQMLREGRIDWVTVTSSAIARSLVRLLGEALPKAKTSAISPITADVMRELGVTPTVVADGYDMPGIVRAMVQYEQAPEK